MVAAGLSTQCSMHRQLVDCSSRSSRINSSRHCTPSSLYNTSSRGLNSPSQRHHLGMSTDKTRRGVTAIQSKLAAGEKPPVPAASISPVLTSVQMEDLIRQQLDRLQHELQQQQQPIVRVDEQSECQRRERWDAIPLWQSTSERDAEARAAATEKWSPLQRMAAAALDAVEERFIPLLERQLPSTADPAVQLKGNFAPVAEQAATPAKVVQGQIPECLRGCAYIRNGANPRFRPSAGHHLFDGDGMLHAVSFTPSGGAAYCARFTRTARLCEEERLGRPIFPKAVGELHGHGGAARLLLFYARAAAGIVDASRGMGPANAGVVFFDGKLLAMSEDDQPYAVRLDPESGDLSTIGRYDFGGQLAAASMIAHPKRDSETGELFALSYDVVKRPYLRYFSFASDGTKQRDVEIGLPSPTMMHDFAITSKYVVVPDQQVVFRLPNMLRGMSPVVCDATKTPRFGVLPRGAEDESGMRWVDVPDCFCFHVWNAWEEVDAETGHEVVVVLGSCMTPPDCVFNDENGDAEMSSVLCEIRLDLVTGTSTRRPLAEGTNLEAGTVNRNLMGRKTRYLYLAVADPWPMISGVAKVDTEKQSETGDCVVGKRIYGENCYGGEPFFIPRTDDPNAAEDDGYVLTLVHNESTDSSELLILDAATDNLEVVARVQLPSRVPYGFHGTFLSAKEVASQH